jgi:hypothetical protein
MQELHYLSFIYLQFIYQCFFSNLDNITLNESVIGDRKECGRKWLWPNLRYYPSIYLERVRKKKLRTAGLQAEI